MPRNLIALCFATLLLTPAAVADRFELAADEHVVVVGNTFAERLAFSGYFEALVHAAHPDLDIVVRQVPWSADEVGIRPREHSVPTIEAHLARFEADVIVMCFGMSESFAGRDGIEAFEEKLTAQVDAFLAETYNGATPPRLVLVSPTEHEDLGAPMVTGAALAERNAVLRLYADAMQRVADARGARFVDLIGPSDRLFAGGEQLTNNGIHPNELGCFHFARAIGDSLGWLDGPSGGTADAAAQLRQLAYDKHYHVRLIYRPTNTEYVWGRRHEPYGIVNFPAEWEQLERMVHAREQAMWAMDLPSTNVLFATPPSGPAIWEKVPSSHDFPEDEWTPAPVEAKGRENSLGNLNILDPDEFARSFTVPEGYVIECFASEQEIPDLQNPLAMSFDARGRLWVLCAPTYPHLMPGEAPRCKLIVVEDTDGDGVADTSSTFADELYVPSGFAIDTDAVYVGQAPDLWKLTDTDGDGAADRREIVASGFGMCDSHHTVSAFEWEPNGGFVFHEGVFTKSNVETPFGVRRTRDAATWRYDPRTQRVDVLSHSGFSNPWGHVFDDYGQSVLADASGGDNYSFSHVISEYEYPQKPKRVGRLLNRGRPTAGCELIASRHFPEDVQGSFLVNQSIGFHGTRWDMLAPAGSAWAPTSMPQDLIACTDTNFRPVAMEIGPDGALYVVDWCNPIIGHMQYNVRDPRRDHTHGRVWRVRHAERPFVEPVEIESATVVELLELLRLPETNTRQLARRRLQKGVPIEVFPELARWVAAIEPDDPERDRFMLESLWIHQAHGRIDLELLDRVATRPEPLARAGAIRVLRHWLQQQEVEMSAALPLLERAVDDEDMRVRLEGVVACGFIPDVAGASVASLAAERDMDDGIRIALEATLEHLSQYGEPQSGIARRLRLERTSAAELAAMPLDDMVAQVTLLRSDVPAPQRVDALAFLAGDKGADQVSRLLDELVAARDREAAAEAIGPVLLAMPKPALARAEAKLQEGAAVDDPTVRSLSVAAMVAVDPGRSDLIGDDGELAVAVLEYLPPGAAPAETVATLRSAAEAGDVDPTAAVAQVARHSDDTGALFDWLGGLVEPADKRGLGDFDDAHVTAMAALRAMNDVPVGDWPEGFETYRVPAADPAMLERGRSVYLDEINGCSRCHGPDGRGEEGFPPLACSPWVLGDPERAAGIVVHGLSGRIEIPDGRTFESAMAPLGANLSDEQVAAVLTFVRQSWGNYAPAVTTADVVRARRLEPRGAMWDAATLAKLYPAYRDRIVAVNEQTSEVRHGRPFVTFLYALGVLLVPVVLVLGVILAADHVLRRGAS